MICPTFFQRKHAQKSLGVPRCHWSDAGPDPGGEVVLRSWIAVGGAEIYRPAVRTELAATSPSTTSLTTSFPSLSVETQFFCSQNGQQQRRLELETS